MSGTEASDAALPIEYAVPEDGNEEMCGACRAGGILLCCEACPAAYHAPCAGYADEAEVPDGEWLCWSCARAVGARFRHPNAPINKEVGQEIMVASGKDAELFYVATVVAVADDRVTVRNGAEFKHSQETFTAASIRFWHGSMDLSTVWEAHQGGGYQPLSRAYAVDYERVVIGNSPKQMPAPRPSYATMGAGVQRSLPLSAAAATKRPAGDVGRSDGSGSAPVAKRAQRSSATEHPLAVYGVTPYLVAKYPLASTLTDLTAECHMGSPLERQRRALLQELASDQSPSNHSTKAGSGSGSGSGYGAGFRRGTGPPSGSESPAGRSVLARASSGSRRPHMDHVSDQARGGGDGDLSTMAGPQFEPTTEEVASMERCPPPFLTSNVVGGAVTVPYYRSFHPAGSEGDFLHHLMRFWALNGPRALTLPIRYFKERNLDVWSLWKLVDKAAAWQAVGRALDSGAPLATITHNARVFYTQLLLEFEKATRAGTSGFVQPKAGSSNPNPAARPSQPSAVSKTKLSRAPERLDPPVSTPNPRPSRAEVHKPSEAGPKGGQASREPWMVPAPLPRGWKLRNLSGNGECQVAKVKAEHMPNPRTPPLKVSKLVGPLNPSVMGRLSAGDAVEVRQQEVGLRGSWYPAKVLQVAKGSVAEGGCCYLVEYAAFTLPETLAKAGVIPSPQPDATGANPTKTETPVPPLPLASTGKSATEWVTLISRSTIDAEPRLLLRRPRAEHGPPGSRPLLLATGSFVEAWWQEGWWEARVVEHTAEGAYRLQSLPEPEGENEIWEAKSDLVRPVNPNAPQHFGMTAPIEGDDMIPLERYRRWLRQHDYRCEGYPIESYACAEQLPGSYMPPPIHAADPLVKEASDVIPPGVRASELSAAKAEQGLMTTDGAVGVGEGSNLSLDDALGGEAAHSAAAPLPLHNDIQEAGAVDTSNENLPDRGRTDVDGGNLEDDRSSEYKSIEMLEGDSGSDADFCGTGVQAVEAGN